MFVLRALMVGSAFFGVAYCGLSLLVAIVWNVARRFRGNLVFKSARSLYALRVFPLVASAFITLALALPAFLLLEGGMDEDIGTLIFSLGTLVLLAVGCTRIATAYLGASSLLDNWLSESKVLHASPLAATFCTKHSAPPLLLSGIRTPKVLVSETAVALLSPEELKVAIRHEYGHLHFRDNFKKLIVHGIPFPGMNTLERAWQEGAEFAADQAAVANSDDALNLASALIKLCRLAPTQQPPAFTTGLVELTALVDLRVHRLLAWNGPTFESGKVGRTLRLLSSVALIGCGISTYGHALVLTHRFTEWFIH